MYKIFFLVFYLFCCSCYSQPTQYKTNSNEQQVITTKVVDSVLFQYSNESFSDEFILNKNLKLFYSVKRDENNKKSIKPYRKNIEMSKNDLQIAINDVPNIFLDSTDKYRTIGIPFEYDQGGYFLKIFSANSVPIIIRIDTDTTQWPLNAKSYIKKLTDILINCSKK